MTWLLILLMALVTYANRVVFLLRSIRFTPSEQLSTFLGYSSYAVLTAIWAPIVFSYSSESGFSTLGLDYVLASCVAAVLTVIRVPSIYVVLLSIGAFAAIRFGF